MSMLKRLLGKRRVRQSKDRRKRRLGFERLEERSMMAAASGDLAGNGCEVEDWWKHDAGYSEAPTCVTEQDGTGPGHRLLPAPDNGYVIKDAPLSTIAEVCDVPAPSIELAKIGGDPLLPGSLINGFVDGEEGSVQYFSDPQKESVFVPTSSENETADTTWDTLASIIVVPDSTLLEVRESTTLDADSIRRDGGSYLSEDALDPPLDHVSALDLTKIKIHLIPQADIEKVNINTAPLQTLPRLPGFSDAIDPRAPDLSVCAGRPPLRHGC